MGGGRGKSIGQNTNLQPSGNKATGQILRTSLVTVIPGHDPNSISSGYGGLHHNL